MSNPLPRAFKNRPNPFAIADGNSEVWQAMLNAWTEAPEHVKAELSRSLAKYAPETFNAWHKCANVTGFQPKAIAGRPPGSRARLDEYARKSPAVLPQAAAAYFIKTAPALNNTFCKRMEERGVLPGQGDPDIVEEVLAELKAVWMPEEPAYVALFCAALRIITPDWWKIPVPEAELQPEDEPGKIEPLEPGASSASPLQGQALAPETLDPAGSGNACPWCAQADLSPTLRHLAAQLPAVLADIGSARRSGQLKMAAQRLEGLETGLPELENLPSPCGGFEGVRPCCDELKSALARGLLTPGAPEVLRAFQAAFDQAQSLQRAQVAELAERRKGLGLSPRPAAGLVPCRLLEAAFRGIEGEQASLDAIEAGRREQILARIRTLEAGTMNQERLALALELRRSLSTGGAVGQVEQDLAALEAELAEDSRAWNPQEVAASLLQADLQGKDLIRLGRAILNSGEPALALAFFRTLQELPIEESGLEDFSDFVETLLLILVAQGSAEVWMDHLRDQPWLNSLARTDIQDEKIALAASAILMAAEYRSMGSFSHLWNGLRCPQNLSIVPHLGQLADAITTQQAWEWFDAERTTRVAASDRALEESSGQVLAEFQKGHKQFREFCRVAQARLREAWAEARAGRLPSLEPQDLCGEFASAAKGEASETFLCKTFNTAIRDYFQELDAHRELVRHSREAPSLQLHREDFDAERANLSHGDPALQRLWDKAAEALEAAPPLGPPEFAASPMVATALGSGAYAQLLPEAVERFNGDLAAGPRPEDLRNMVERMVRPLELPEVIERLEASGSTCQIRCVLALSGLAGPSPSPEEVTEQLSREIGHLPSLVARQDLQKALKEGRFLWVKREVATAEAMLEKDRISFSAQINTGLAEVKVILQNLEDQANASEAAEAWKDQTQAAIGELLDRLKWASRPQQTVEEKQETLNGVLKILELVKDHVNYLAQDFELLRFPSRPAPELEEGCLLPWAGDPDRQELWTLMEKLGDASDPRTVRKSLEGFLLGFAKAAKMYGNPPDRCKFATEVGFPYPLLHTSFHKPGSEVFNKPFRIYLLPGPAPEKDLLERVRREAEASRLQAITLVLLPGLAKAAKKFFDRDTKAGLLVLMDRTLLEQTLAAEHAHKPLRQLLRRRISLEEATPFLSTGNLDKNAHLYIPIGNIEGKLINGHSWVILGGRRSGKSTLLHAVKEILTHKKDPYRCAFISLESMPEKVAKGGNPDLIVALEIARQFGWDYPAHTTDLNAFESALREQAQTTRTCVLLDELDAYIQWHRDREQYRYPVIRSLRNVSQEFRGSSDNLVCLFAGFKDLMRACRHPVPSDPSYPWGNFLHEIRTPCMDINETKALVDEGFREILGLEVDPEVPNRIFKYTAGHPAFVQKLCDLILSRLEKQGRDADRIRVTLDEVDRTYQFLGGNTEDRSFIRYVQRTLDLNLANLDKVIAYMFAVNLIGPEENYETPVSVEKIQEEVTSWFKDFGRKIPGTPEIQEALDNLVMTGMLTPLGTGRLFKMTFRSFVEILRMLEEADKDTIFRLIGELEG